MMVAFISQRALQFTRIVILSAAKDLCGSLNFPAWHLLALFAQYLKRKMASLALS